MLLDLKHWTSRGVYFTGAYYDLPTQLLLREMLRPGDTFVDIGANEGMISLLASRLVGQTGRVISFEPNPIPRSYLERAIEQNGIVNIQVEPYGVGDEHVVLPLRVPKINSGQGSFGEPDSSAGDAYELECEIKPADQLLRDCAPSLVKIDVEGFEYRVLQGIRETLERNTPPVIMELIGAHLHRAGTTVEEVSNFMAALGYSAETLNWKKGQGVFLTPAKLSDEMAQDVIWKHQESA
jgi:FkbM family methyltransferase